jgi:quercetin dioxygenase-like cupin family protein
MSKACAEIGKLARLKSRAYGEISMKLLQHAGFPLSAQHIEIPPHARTTAIYHAKTSEFIFVLKGDLWTKFDGRRRVLHSGDFAFLPAGVVHQFRAGKKGVRVLAVFNPPLDFDHPDVVRAP